MIQSCELHHRLNNSKIYTRRSPRTYAHTRTGQLSPNLVKRYGRTGITQFYLLSVSKKGNQKEGYRNLSIFHQKLQQFGEERFGRRITIEYGTNCNQRRSAWLLKSRTQRHYQTISTCFLFWPAIPSSSRTFYFSHDRYRRRQTR